MEKPGNYTSCADLHGSRHSLSSIKNNPAIFLKILRYNKLTLCIYLCQITNFHTGDRPRHFLSLTMIPDESFLLFCSTLTIEVVETSLTIFLNQAQLSLTYVLTTAPNAVQRIHLNIL